MELKQLNEDFCSIGLSEWHSKQTLWEYNNKNLPYHNLRLAWYERNMATTIAAVYNIELTYEIIFSLWFQYISFNSSDPEWKNESWLKANQILSDSHLDLESIKHYITQHDNSNKFYVKHDAQHVMMSYTPETYHRNLVLQKQEYHNEVQWKLHRMEMLEEKQKQVYYLCKHLEKKAQRNIKFELNAMRNL